MEKVGPSDDSPFSLGRMCVKGLAAPEIMYHPDRLLHPLKRSGDRGSGNWTRVTWDHALSDISAQLRAVREQTGPESVALGQAPVVTTTCTW